MPRLELWAGPPGTGKTARCIELFRERVLQSPSGIQSRSYFVLPSREHAGRIQNLILRQGAAGLFNAHILTLQDLADQVLPDGSGRPTDSVRRAVIAEALAATRDGETLYPYFKASLGLPGFEALMLESVREIKSSLLSAGEFDQRASKLLKDPVFRSKYRDFSILLKRYDARLKELGLSEPEDELASLASIADAGWRPDLVLFDGFYHFSRAQRKLLSLVAERAAWTVVTLTLDPAHAAGEALFSYVSRTRGFLLASGFQETRLAGENRRASDPGLRHLAAHVFAPKPVRYQGAAPVTLISAPSLRSEYEMIAQEIRRLYREEDVHFSDLCVILRAVSGQRSLIESVFGAHGVPVMLHERSRLTDSGLVTALFRLLRLAAEDWKREDVLYLARSSYFRKMLSSDDALAIERAALREGVAEGREGWRALAQGLEGKPKDFIEWLLGCESRLLASKSVHIFASSVDGLLSSLDLVEEASVFDTAARRGVASILAAGRRRYGAGRETFDAARFIEETLTAIEQGLFSLKAPTRNRVQVYDAVMVLPKEYKVVFVADLLERSFPQPYVEDPLFKDAERRQLNGKDPVLEERAWRLSGERYFFYMAVTRARERVFLTHSLYDADGRPTLPSFFIDEVKRCFAEGSMRSRKRGLSDLLPGPEEWESATDVVRGTAAMAARGGRQAAFAKQLLSRWEAPQALLEAALRGPGTGPAVLKDPRVLESLKKLSGPFSASRLEAFLKCPFKYFAGSHLKLREPLEGREHALMGDLLHETLREYFAETLSEAERASGSYREDPAKMREDLSAIFRRRFDEGPFRAEPLYRRTAWREELSRMLSRYVDLASASGDQVPTHFEYAFGESTKNPLRIKSPDGDILLKGSIDRVDVGPAGAVVIDYKKSSRDLKKKLQAGEEIQLPIYLLAVRDLLGLEPAGLEHHVLKTGSRERPKDVSPEDIPAILDGVVATVRESVARIRRAEIGVAPKDCQYCDFDAVCRVERKKGRDF